MATGKKDFKAITDGVNEGLAGLRDMAGDTLSAFSGLSKAANADGAIDHKTKELIALAIGVAKQCDACIGFHTKALKKLGASDQEVADTLGVCVYMGGGPSLMYAADAWTAWTQLKD
ncbi:carboxymuconolactone decarboxylase family protein [Henriciella mobilis]|uniref:carboxymuconolactone decarboxylase family protein n=1 Tax=Henriciella mobilis TaxID=2305467 RepID=UPI000E6760A8|nr:carboxymuconolactone decarboxylase family protein [Henriciella mobilis]RIJ16101.1 carboxymuconolactone decarboxylase family protein [Henriciella mobilis]RIJ22987.1 carboxymuconolactone decarboxylase family protein [Henriciella mobilis]